MVLNGMIDGIDFWRDDPADFYVNTTSQPSLSLIAKVWSTRSDQQDSANGGQASKNNDASKARSEYKNIGRTQAKDTFYLISTADSPVLASRPHDRATLGSNDPQDHYNKRGIYNFS